MNTKINVGILGLGRAGRNARSGNCPVSGFL